MTEAGHRILLHLADGLRRVVEPSDVYHLELLKQDTRVRLRSAEALVDADTGMPTWQGESWDLGWAVYAYRRLGREDSDLV